MFKIVNGYEDVDRNMFFKLKEGSRTIKGGSQMAMVDRIIRKITHHSGPPVY